MPLFDLVTTEPTHFWKLNERFENLLRVPKDDFTSFFERFENLLRVPKDDFTSFFPPKETPDLKSI